MEATRCKDHEGIIQIAPGTCHPACDVCAVAQLTGVIVELEARVAERTRELELSAEENAGLRNEVADARLAQIEAVGVDRSGLALRIAERTRERNEARAKLRPRIDLDTFQAQDDEERCDADA